MDTTEQTWRWAKNHKGGKCKRWIQTDTWTKILYGTKRLKHAMLRNSRAEFECDILQRRWDDCAVTQCIHITGEEKLCLRSRQPTRELVREERKRISEMERLESKLDRSDRACQLRCSHRRSYSCTQPEIQSNLLQSIICKIGNHPQDCSTGITTQIHAKEKWWKSGKG